MQALKDPSEGAILALAKKHVAGQARREEDCVRLIERLRAERSVVAAQAPAF
jgi:hypothetical protein